MSDDDFEIIRQLGEAGAQGVVSLVEFPNKLRAAMKQFKPKKSSARIQAEADYQQRAADADIAPEVMHVDLEKKRIFSEVMNARVIDIVPASSSRRLSEDLHHVMTTLDRIGILHNDGNVRNLMLNHKDKLQIIDFGLSKEITPTVRKKWDGEPNIKVTLRLLRNGLKKYHLEV
jgi:tRNA A-37 threonylcarbamoyl transferase component Bud32